MSMGDDDIIYQGKNDMSPYVMESVQAEDKTSEIVSETKNEVLKEIDL